MSASKGQYTAQTVTLVEGDVRTNRLTQDGRLMVDATGSSGGTAAALADATANPTVLSQGAYISGFNGTTWDRLRTAITTVSSTLTGFLVTLPWALYHSSPATRTNGQGAPLETDATGNLRNVEQFAPAYEDNTAGVAKVEHRYSYTHITTATTTVVKASAGFLHKIIWNKRIAAGATTVYDNTSAAGTVVAIVTVGAAILSDPPTMGEYNVTMATGITVVTSQAEDITVVWR